MKRTFTVGLFVLLIGAGTLLADVITAKIEKIDTEKNTVTVKVKGKSTDYPVQKDAVMFYKPVGKKKGVDITEGLKGLKVGQEVTLYTEAKDGKEVVTQVRVEEAGPGKKKKDK